MTTVPRFFGRRLVSEVTIAAGTPAVTFNNLQQNCDYEIEALGVYGSAAAGIYFKTSTDNGATFNAGASDYNFLNFAGNGATASSGGQTASAFGVIFGSLYGTTALQSTDFICKLREPINPSFKTRVQSQYGGLGSSVVFSGLSNSERVAAEANNAIQIYPSTGTFSGGKINIWEIPKS